MPQDGDSVMAELYEREDDIADLLTAQGLDADFNIIGQDSPTIRLIKGSRSASPLIKK